MAVKREQVIRTAEKLVAKGKVEAAIREYRKVLSENPNDTSTLNRVGDLYARLSRFDEAVKLFGQIAEQYTGDGFFVKAIAIYKKIIKLDPTRLEVYEKLAELYHRQGLRNEARTQYQVLADYYLKHNESASAINILNRMAELEPDNPSHHLKLAELYQQERLWDKAMKSYRTIAEMMLTAGHVEEAAQVYQRAIEVKPDDIAFITDAVLGLKDAGHVAAAAHLLAVAVEQNPQAEKVARIAGLRHDTEAISGHEVPTGELEIVELTESADHADDEVLAGAVLESAAAAFEVDEELELEIEEEPELAGEAGFALPPPDERVPELVVEGGEPDAFVLDLDEDEPPPSLVQPPADLLEGPGSSFRRESEEVDLILDLDVGEPVDQAGLESAEELDLELPLDEEIELILEEDAIVSGPLEGEEREGQPAAPIDWSFELDSLETLDLGEVPLDIDPGDAPPSGGMALPPAIVEPPPEATQDAVLEVEDAVEEAELFPPVAEAQSAKIVESTVASTAEEDLLAEAEVFAKYGLEEKALDRVRELLEHQPQNVGAQCLLVELHLKAGRADRVVATASRLAEAASLAEPPVEWLKVRQKLERAGYQIDGDTVIAPPAGVVKRDRISKLLQVLVEGEARTQPSSKAPAARSGQGAIDEALAALASRTLADRSRATGGAAEPAESSPPPLVTSETLSDPLASEPLLVDGLAGVEEPTVPLAVEQAEPSPARAPDAADVVADQPAPGGVAVAGEPADAAAAPFNLAAALQGELDEVAETPKEDWLESEEALEAPTPTSLGAEADALPDELLADLEGDFEPELADALPEEVGPASPDGLDDAMSWLDETPVAAVTAAGAEALFDDEEQFFDLAAELEQELGDDNDLGDSDLLGQPGEEPSLEEIVEGFKRGVAENLSEEDYDTHYNLGIAYREMGLLDEAIGEFQLASKDLGHLVECCSMLGVCFLEKGLPELAVKWYRKGLECPDLTEEAMLGLLYDMGNVYRSMGDDTAAYKTFVEVYGVNTNYRDIIARMEELAPR